MKKSEARLILAVNDILCEEKVRVCARVDRSIKREWRMRGESECMEKRCMVSFLEM